MIRSASKAFAGTRAVERLSSSHQGISGSSKSASTKTSNNQPSNPAKQTSDASQDSVASPQETKPDEQKKTKSMAELDEELRLKLEGISGGGGEAGLELENGQPVAMKRGVKQNMFRLI